MYIKIIAVGKLKYDTFEQLANDYLKRLKAWHVEVIEVPELQDIEKESVRIAGLLKTDWLNVVLDVDGREFRSPEFAEFLRETRDFEGGKICFVIGGAHGLPEHFKKTFAMRLSFGRLTFTHQFTRVLLLEQLFRASSILSGKKYHY